MKIRRKIQLSFKDEYWFGTVSIPKLFLDMWVTLGATHCLFEYDEKTNIMKLYPEIPHR